MKLSSDCAQFGENALPRTPVFAWYKKFSGRCEEVANLSHVRHQTSATAENSEVIRELIAQNERISLLEIVDEVKIRHGSAQNIVADDLEFLKGLA